MQPQLLLNFVLVGLAYLTHSLSKLLLHCACEMTLDQPLTIIAAM